MTKRMQGPTPLQTVALVLKKTESAVGQALGRAGVKARGLDVPGIVRALQGRRGYNFTPGQLRKLAAGDGEPVPKKPGKRGKLGALPPGNGANVPLAKMILERGRRLCMPSLDNGSYGKLELVILSARAALYGQGDALENPADDE